MSQPHRPARVEEIDWAALFPFVRLLGSFRMAIHPAKLFVALMMVTLIWGGGHLLDLVSGPGVYPGEYDQYVHSSSTQRFDHWLEGQQRLSEGGGSARELEGVFKTALRAKLDVFERLVIAATRLNFGVHQLAGTQPLDRQTVVVACYELAVTLPGWLFHAHRGFLLMYGLLGIGVWSLGGAMLARMAALEASRDIPADLGGAYEYARSNWAWFVMALIGPLIVIALIGVVLIGGGFVFFNLPILDALGGLLFVIALVFGAGMTLLLVLYLTGHHLFYPAMAVEGPDPFDAISRSFNYVISRPWRWVFYNAVALLYGAVTYLFVGMVVFVTLWMTHRFVGMGVVRELESGASRFDAILPAPRLGQLTYENRSSPLSLPGQLAAVLVFVWRNLTIGLVAAYAVSYYFCAHTWIYLLLRCNADGTGFDEVYLEEAAGTGERSAVEPGGAETEAVASSAGQTDQDSQEDQPDPASDAAEGGEDKT